MFLDYFALFLVFFVLIFVFYAVIAIHDIPYEISVHRQHPHQDAIHIAGWVSLFTLHVLWPFLWIWATLYRPDRGWGMRAQVPNSDPAQQTQGSQPSSQTQQLDELRQQLAQLQRQYQTLEQRLVIERAVAPSVIDADTDRPESTGGSLTWICC